MYHNLVRYDKFMGIIHSCWVILGHSIDWIGHSYDTKEYMERICRVPIAEADRFELIVASLCLLGIPINAYCNAFYIKDDGNPVVYTLSLLMDKETIVAYVGRPIVE